MYLISLTQLYIVCYLFYSRSYQSQVNNQSNLTYVLPSALNSDLLWLL